MSSDKISELNTQLDRRSFAFLKLTKRLSEDRISVSAGAASNREDARSVLASVLKPSTNKQREHGSLDVLSEAICRMNSGWKMGQVPVFHSGHPQLP